MSSGEHWACSIDSLHSFKHRGMWNRGRRCGVHVTSYLYEGGSRCLVYLGGIMLQWDNIMNGCELL